MKSNQNQTVQYQHAPKITFRLLFSKEGRNRVRKKWIGTYSIKFK